MISAMFIFLCKAKETVSHLTIHSVLIVAQASIFASTFLAPQPVLRNVRIKWVNGECTKKLPLVFYYFSSHPPAALTGLLTPDTRWVGLFTTPSNSLRHQPGVLWLDSILTLTRVSADATGYGLSPTRLPLLQRLTTAQVATAFRPAVNHSSCDILLGFDHVLKQLTELR